MSVIDEIAAERRRQVEIEGWTAEHDDAHELGEMAAAAACYAFQTLDNYDPYALERIPDEWPWHASWWKPKSPRRDLVRAAALLVAEIERLDRSSAPSQSTGDDR